MTMTEQTRRRSDVFFRWLTADDRLCFVARDLGYLITNRDAWPRAVIDELIELRRMQGVDAYRERVAAMKAARAAVGETGDAK